MTAVLAAEFTKSTRLFNDPATEGVEIDAGDQAYVEFFSTCPVYEITGRRDFDAAVELCYSLIR